jgi:hypothetical protein
MVGVAYAPVKDTGAAIEGFGVLELAVLVAVDIAVIGTALVLRQPKLLIPLVILGLPIEYFATATLDTFGEGGIRGGIRALLVPGKAAMLATILIVLFQHRHDPRGLLPRTSLLFPITAFVGVIFIGVAWSDSLVPPNGILILPMYLAFAFVAPKLIEDRTDVERIYGAFFAIAIPLALLAVIQRFGVFNWRDVLIQSDEVSYRSNATFGDPNVLARYLAVTITLGLGLIIVTGPRRLTLYLAGPAVAAGLLGIVASASRSGWIMLAFCVGMLVLFAPTAAVNKVKILGGGAVLVVAFLSFLLAQGGADAQRVRTLWSGVEIIGQREYLIRAGWEMWKDSPVIGVGSGNYQHTLITSYLDVIPTWARASLSHTSFISILAELGLVGVAALAFVCTRVAVVNVRTALAARDAWTRLAVLWVGTSLLGIVLHSQSEGRFTDEPYLWLFLGLLITLESRFVSRSAHAVPVPVDATQVAAAVTARRATPLPAGAQAVADGGPR